MTKTRKAAGNPRSAAKNKGDAASSLKAMNNDPFKNTNSRVNKRYDLRSDYDRNCHDCKINRGLPCCACTSGSSSDASSPEDVRAILLLHVVRSGRIDYHVFYTNLPVSK